MGATGMKPRPDSVHLRNAPSGRAVLTTEAMPTFLDPTPVLSTMRYLTAAYALVATVLTTACLTLHLVTRMDRIALRRRRSGREPAERRPLFVPLEQSPAASG